ncbi:unnamed protein product [Musa hybrid cultivar]
MALANTPAGPARLRHAPRLFGFTPPETTPARPQPACVVFLGPMFPRQTCAACPPASCSLAPCSRDTLARCLSAEPITSSGAVSLGRMALATTPARSARLRRAPRLFGLRLPRPRLRGLPACLVLLGFTPPETTPARPACPRRAPRLFGFTPPETTPARPARLRRAPRLYATRDHACAACLPASCSSALRLYATRDHACADCPPASHTCAVFPHASCSSTSSSQDTPARFTRLRRAPRPPALRTHPRGSPACVVLLDLQLSGHTCAVHPPASCSSTSSSQDTPARFTRLRRAPRPPALRTHMRERSPRPCCAPRPSTLRHPETHLSGHPAHVVLLGPRPSALRLPKITPARSPRLRCAPRPSALRLPKPHLRSHPACAVLLSSSTPESNSAHLPD